MSGWTPEQWIIFFGGLIIFLTQAANLYTSIRNGSRTKTAINEIRDNTDKTEQIRVATDGLTTQLTAATRTAGIAEGRDQMEAETAATEVAREQGRVEGRAEKP